MDYFKEISGQGLSTLHKSEKPYNPKQASLVDYVNYLNFNGYYAGHVRLLKILKIQLQNPLIRILSGIFIYFSQIFG